MFSFKVTADKNLNKIKIIKNDIFRDLRGDLFNELYQIRNYIFQINPSSTRNMIPGHYLKNFQALEDLLSISNSKSIFFRSRVTKIH